MKLTKAGKADWRRNWHRTTIWKCGCMSSSGYGEKLYIYPCGDLDCDILHMVIKHNKKVAELAEAGRIEPQLLRAI